MTKDFLAISDWSEQEIRDTLDLARKMKAGEIQSSPCEPCNKCVAEMESGGIRCTHPQLGTASNQLPPSNAT